MTDLAGLRDALRQVLTPVNVAMAVAFAAGVTMLALGCLQLLWPPQPAPQSPPEPAPLSPPAAEHTRQDSQSTQ